MKNKKRLINTALLISIGVIIGTLLKIAKDATNRDYEDIIESGEIRVATTYNSIDYFLDEDTIAGFQYEMIKSILKNRGFKINISPFASLSQQIGETAEGKYDIIASNITSMQNSKEKVNLTIPITTNRQVLIQRRDSTYIKSQLDLAKKKLYVVKNSPAIFRINNLSNEIADTIYIEELEKYGQDALATLVAHSNIDYAVCDEIIAQSEARNFDNIDIDLAIGFTQFYSWGVNKEAPILLDSLNIWIDNFINSKAYEELYTKYFDKNS